MYRCLLAIAGVLGVAACTVEPTPREYIDRQVPTSDVHEQTEAALRDQVLRLIGALRMGDGDAARDALFPAEEVVIIGPGEEQRLTGPAQADAIVDLASATRIGRLELRDLQVHIAPRGTTGWFAATLEFHRHDGANAVPLRVTGLYVERDAVWELQQAHLSVPSDALIAPAGYPPGPSLPGEAG